MMHASSLDECARRSVAAEDAMAPEEKAAVAFEKARAYACIASQSSGARETKAAQPGSAPEYGRHSLALQRPTKRKPLVSDYVVPQGNATRAPVALTSRMSDVAPQPIAWLWQPRIALGKLTIIAGDPGLGKSMLTASLAAHVSMGCAWPDRRAGVLGSVVLISGEDDPADTIRPRLDAAGADVERVHYLRAIADPVGGERSFSLSDVAALKELLARIGDCRLVVIDPISAYLGGTDSHKNAEVRALLSPLAALAAEHGVAIVAVTHLNKGQAAAMYRMTGSLAFVAAARAAYIVVRDKNDAKRRLMLPLKNNLGDDTAGLAYRIETAQGVPFVAWESEPVTVTAEEALAPEVDRKDPAPARADAIDFLRSLLADKECSVDVVKVEAKKAGLSWATVRRAKDALGVRSRKSAMAGDGFGTFPKVLILPKALTPGVVSTFLKKSTLEPLGTRVLTRFHRRCSTTTMLIRILTR